VRKGAKESRMSFVSYLFKGSDPMGVAVFVEDGAALMGILIASSCLTASYITNNPIYDAYGSVMIGVMLGGFAFLLIRKNSAMLVGRAIPESQTKELIQCLENDEVVTSVHNVRAYYSGAHSISFKAELEFDAQAIAQKNGVEKQPELINMILEQQILGDKAEVEKAVVKIAAKSVESVGDEVDRLKLKLKGVNKNLKFIDLESN